MANLLTEEAPDNTETAATAQAQDVKQDAGPAPAVEEVQTSATVAEKPAETKPPVETAPEKYEDFKAPEGMAIDLDTLGRFTDLAKKAGLTQEKAQGFFDVGTAMFTKVMSAAAEAAEKQSVAWRAEAEKDKEIGGDKLESSCKNARLFLKNVLGDQGRADFIKILDSYGLSNHPSLIKILSKGYQATREDQSPRSQAGANRGDDLSVLYPSMAES